ncbi:hypothetical protein HCZ23_07015 [Celeribacter sp. HF31]|uniref:hypothetical protein n=1 Tax=Celeribacter sp. HF31 TaxID=2721558 RepID=UPI00142FF04F|nr:hypothetical protein [Celeribacter sp. HF31]NIY79218.1 hypothetical protein [Celeribacter sp. HF31]
MEKLTLLLPKTTVEMMHLLARTEGRTMGAIVQEMALDRYMQQMMSSQRTSETEVEASEVQEA